MTQLTQRLLRAIRASKLPDKALVSAIVDADKPKPREANSTPAIEPLPKRRGRPPKYQTRVMKADE